MTIALLLYSSWFYKVMPPFDLGHLGYVNFKLFYTING